MQDSGEVLLLHAFHGFLGGPDDFRPLAQAIAGDFAVIDAHAASPVVWEPSASGSAAVRVVAWDIEGYFLSDKMRTWRDWPDLFADEVARRFGDSAARHSLLGYSLGGRLAYHLLGGGLAAKPLPQWEQAIIVSAHPGLPPAERAARLANDEEWARRLRDDPWEDTIRAWNAQPPLATSATLPPSCRDQEGDPGPQRRAVLAQIMTGLSLARQEDLRSLVSDFVGAAARRLLLVAGAGDSKFVGVLRDLQAQTPAAELWVCEGAGHRVPWDQPERFAARVAGFLVGSVNQPSA